MVPTETHLWLLAIAVFAFALILIGFRWQARSTGSRTRIAGLAALACIAAPFIATRFGATDGQPELQRSLLIAAIGVFAVSLYALLSSNAHRAKRRPGSLSDGSRSLEPFAIDADGYTSAAPARAETTKPSDGSDAEGLQALDDAIVDAGQDRHESEPAVSPPSHELATADVGDRRGVDVDVGSSVAANADDAALDLPETQQLFRALRDDAAVVDLPDDQPWLRADAPTALPQGTEGGQWLPADEEPVAEHPTPTTEAELVTDASPAEEDSTSAAAGGEPDGDEREAALAQQMLSRSVEATETSRRLIRAERLVDTEREARLTAERLAESQRGLIEDLQEDVARWQARAEALDADQATRDEAVERASEMARTAARVAREAAEVRRDLERQLASEREALARQQRATDRAVAIARNAIAALPPSVARSASGSAMTPAPLHDVHEAEINEPDRGDSDSVGTEASIADPATAHDEPFDR